MIIELPKNRGFFALDDELPDGLYFGGDEAVLDHPYFVPIEKLMLMRNLKLDLAPTPVDHASVLLMSRYNGAMVFRQPNSTLKADVNDVVYIPSPTIRRVFSHLDRSRDSQQEEPVSQCNLHTLYEG